MATYRIGINGCGRIGRLALRMLAGADGIAIAHINDPAAPAATLAHLLEFDSVHGHWDYPLAADGDTLVLGQQRVPVSAARSIDEADWSGCDLVVEASGKMRDTETLQHYLQQGVKHVLVSAPVKGAVNLVMGVNDDQFDPGREKIFTAASCTTNCLAPVVKVIHEAFGVRHGSMTTVHGITNDQVVLDAAHKDLRRARSCGSSLIPTTTNSAKLIGEIIPELNGRINGRAVRVPTVNASLTDCVFEVRQETTVEAVNAALKSAADGALKGILGYEERALVSADYRGDSRSSIVDAALTQVIDGTLVKVYSWYDNEWGYACRLTDWVKRLAGQH